MTATATERDTTQHRQRLREELESLRQKEGVLRARIAVEWAAKHTRSALYQEIDRQGLWDDTAAAAIGRDHCMRQIIREVYLLPVNPEDATPRTREIRLIPRDPDTLVSDYLPASRDPGADADESTGGYVALRDIHKDPEMRARQVARFRWETETLLARYAGLGLKEIDAVIVSISDVTGFTRPGRLRDNGGRP